MIINDEETKKLINDVIFSVVRTFDTQRVDKKMRDEVLPGLMKIDPEIMKKMRNISRDAENFLDSENPEW